MIKKNWQKALISVLFTELAGVLSSLFAGNVKGQYLELAKPVFSPPGWVFGVVWPVLYALMGFAAYLIYASRAGEKEKKQALKLYGLQLLFNFCWSIVFFGIGMLWGSVIVIVILDLLVVLTMVSFYKINRTAAYLLVPYLLWILFATYLNIGMALLN